MSKSNVQVPEPDATWAKQALREASLRATAARVAVLKVLGAAATPMSHAEVVEALAEFGFDQSTLFRCLNEIADAGLVSRLDLWRSNKALRATKNERRGRVHPPSLHVRRLRRTNLHGRLLGADHTVAGTKTG